MWISAVRASDTGRSVDFGALIFPSSVPPDPPSRARFVQTCYPSEVSEADAALVSVIAGEERTGIDITVRSITTATISGTVAIPVGVAASGAAVQCRSSAWVSIRLAKSVPRGERYVQI